MQKLLPYFPVDKRDFLSYNEHIIKREDNMNTQTVRIFEECNNVKLKIEFGPRRSGDVAEIYSDTKKSNELLNWKVKKTVKEALQSAYLWEIKKDI